MRNTFLVGDLHGKQSELLSLLKTYDISDSSIICLGDCGVGFNNTSIQKNYSWLSKNLKYRNNTCYFIRGNHDNPSHWKDESIFNKVKEKYSNIIHLFDNTIIDINNENYYILGGATSIDRIFRKESLSYWKDEVLDFNYINKDNIKIKAILSHIGPIPPSISAQSLPSYILKDNSLIDDLNKEQQLIDTIIETIKPDKWFFGHYHIDESFTYKDVRCICLNELSLRQL